MLSVRNPLKYELLVGNVYYWCDPQIALAWIKSTNKELKTFIKNRVTETRKNTFTKNLHSCKTKENPLDLITRKQIIDLNSNKLWWEGIYVPKVPFRFLINWNTKLEIKFWFSFLYWSWDIKHKNVFFGFQNNWTLKNQIWSSVFVFYFNLKSKKPNLLKQISYAITINKYKRIK